MQITEETAEILFEFCSFTTFNRDIFTALNLSGLQIVSFIRSSFKRIEIGAFTFRAPSVEIKIAETTLHLHPGKYDCVKVAEIA